MSEMGQTTSLFFLLFGLFVVTNGEDLFGPTLVAKVGDVPGAGSVAWVGTGCQLAVVNTTILNTDLNQNIIAQTTCNGDDTITALGISSDSHSAVITTGKSYVQYMSLVDNEIVLKETTEPTGDLYYKFSRISNAYVYHERDIYFAVTNHNETHQGRLYSLYIYEDKEVLMEAYVDFINIIDISDVVVSSTTSTDDDTMTSILYITSSTGILKCLYKINSLITELSLVEIIQGEIGDGMSLSTGYAYVAGQDHGLVVYDLVGEGEEVSQTDLSGWAGGAAYHNEITLIAADPGLYGYDVSDPYNPKLKWLCSMGDNGTGWNVVIHQSSSSSCYAYVSDYSGGLQIVKFCNDDENGDDDSDDENFQPEVVAHFGTGEIQTC